ncbi:hypothetical protein BD310DRAFT_299120 [Dichomitus squalens]|uniref:Secreted protein n=1 Tax=Dichomitus squalens TaxID=114155 RepID=A0A4V2K9S8_9APHY|nr:hypothetical protein BD310DRAFT_299120 [Dichomitus squalens]
MCPFSARTRPRRSLNLVWLEGGMLLLCQKLWSESCAKCAFWWETYDDGVSSAYLRTQSRSPSRTCEATVRRLSLAVRRGLGRRSGRGIGLGRKHSGYIYMQSRQHYITCNIILHEVYLEHVVSE